MARQAGFQLENNFTKGLITEASGLNFPENACTETFDCVFSEKGRVTRRLGFDYEGASEFDIVNKTDGVFVEFVWSSAGGAEDRTIVVQQVGSTLHFYDAAIDDSLSAGHFAHTTDLLDFEVGTSTDVKGNICQFSSGEGFLFVVHPLCEPFYVEWDGVTTFTETAIAIQTRDFEGDKADVDYSNYETRPAALSDAHEYNLINQGWYGEVKIDGGSLVNPITAWDTARTDFPSNSDIWWIFRNSGQNLNVSAIVGQQAIGNTPAPKGHVILDEFDTDRTAQLSSGTVTERTSNGQRPSTTAFFTGRIWYSGVDAQEYNQKIYFSQILDATLQFGKCYQKNDPTSSEQADLLPDDGGVISIQDAGTIFKLFPMADGILVFASNGVWSIGGSEGVGFKATDYAVRKISSVGTISPLSFVDVYGQPFWWNRDGIFTIGKSELPGGENVVSLTDDTIKDFIIDIPSINKRHVKGAFDTRNKIIQWVYRQEEAADINELYTYDRVLNLNLLAKSFYPWKITQPDSGPEVHGIVATRGPASASALVPVTDSLGAIVTDSSGDTVFVFEFAEESDTISFRYTTTVNIDADEWNMTWSQTINDTYLDWIINEDDVDYDSYLITGYKIHGGAIRFWESNYVTIFMSTEDDSSCFFQGVWDYAASDTSARYTTPQQVYRSRLQRDVQQTRKKLRGRGRSLQYKFYSETGKPFTLHGWATWETQNASV